MDERDCPKCREKILHVYGGVIPTVMHSSFRMEQKGTIGNIEIWQCPTCKNVEVLYN